MRNYCSFLAQKIAFYLFVVKVRLLFESSYLLFLDLSPSIRGGRGLLFLPFKVLVVFARLPCASPYEAGLSEKAVA